MRIGALRKSVIKENDEENENLKANKNIEKRMNPSMKKR